MSTGDEANFLTDGCGCTGCQTLLGELGGDVGLARLYGKKLLQRGWAGKAGHAERAYMAAHAPWFRRMAGVGAPHRFGSTHRRISRVPEASERMKVAA